MPARSLRSGTGTRSTPVSLEMNANCWPAFHLRESRTALGIEIWNFAESVAVSGMVIPLFDRSGMRKELARADPSRRPQGGGIEDDLRSAIFWERGLGARSS